MFLTHILSAVAFLATVVFSTYPLGILAEDEMLSLYEPFAWMCLHVPTFVESHEWWIEVVGMVRCAWLAFVLRDRA